MIDNDTRRRPWIRGIGVVASVLSAVALAACGQPAESEGGDSLTIQSGIAGFGAFEFAYEDVVEAFQKANPDIDVKYTARTFEEMLNVGRLQLTGNAPPDVLQVNGGYEAFGAFAGSGLLVPLEDYSAEYGWEERVPENFLDLNARFSDDGTKMGSGTLWGMSTSAFWVSLWMNMDVAAELGIEEAPESLAELEEQLQLAKDGGVVPFQLGTADGAQTAWMLTNLMLATSGPDAVNDVVFHEEGASFEEDPGREAATLFQDWAESGYFTPDWTAYTNDDAFRSFLDGNGLFTLNGTWQLPFQDGPKDSIRVMTFPSDDPDQLAALQSGDVPWVIPAASENHDLAAKFLDFLVSDEAQEIFLENGILPAVPVDGMEDTLADLGFGQTMVDSAMWNARVVEEGGAVPYIDWAAPGLLDSIHSGMDELGAGRITPEEFTQRLQSTYETALTGK